MMREFEDFSCESVDEDDLWTAREIIGINLTLAGLRCAVVIMDDRGMTWDAEYCLAEEKDEIASELATRPCIEMNKHHGLQVVEASNESLKTVRSNLLRSLSGGLSELS